MLPQGWLRANSSGSLLNSQAIGTGTQSSRRSARSGTLSAPPPPVLEVDESNLGGSLPASLLLHQQCMPAAQVFFKGFF